MGNLANSISDGIKDAMRAKDRDRLSALRDIKSKIMLEATKEGAGDTVDDAVTMSILSKLLKQRKETAALYHEQGRADLAAEEEAQAAVIQEFLPAALSEEEESQGHGNHCSDGSLFHGRHGQSHGHGIQSHGWTSIIQSLATIISNSHRKTSYYSHGWTSKANWRSLRPVATVNGDFWQLGCPKPWLFWQSWQPGDF